VDSSPISTISSRSISFPLVHEKQRHPGEYPVFSSTDLLKHLDIQPINQPCQADRGGHIATRGSTIRAHGATQKSEERSSGKDAADFNRGIERIIIRAE